MTHAFATVAIAFPESQANRVETLLREMGAPAAPEWGRALDAAGGIHFMSINVVRGTRPETAHLLIEVSADGSVKQALGTVARVLGDKLARALELMGRGADFDRRPDALAKLLIRYNRPMGQGWFAPALGLPFDGSPGMSVRRLRDEQWLARRIGSMEKTLCAPASAREKLEEVRRVLWQEDAAKWAFVAEPAPMLNPPPQPSSDAATVSLQTVLSLLWPGLKTLLWPLLGPMFALWGLFAWLFWSVSGVGAFVLGALLAVFVSALAIGGVLYWAQFYLNRLEATDLARDKAPNPEKIGELMRSEGVCAQGLLASVSTMKPGRFRRLALRFAFWIIAVESSRESRPGFLGQIADIHFARWFLLPGADKLFFWSNYDGAWESYVEDFIQLGHSGVTAIWSNTEDFPRTSDLFQGGASDGDRLRRWARVQMYPPLFWYSAYPDLTLARIRSNAAIRQGIASARTDAEAEDWLSLFGSAPASRPTPQTPWAADPTQLPSTGPVPPPTLEKREIPTLVFGGRRHLPHATCLVIEMAGRPGAHQPGACRDWLRRIEPDITYGEDRGRSWALAFALSSTGFDKLGLPRADLDTFSAIFRNGMTAPWRSVALGDEGENRPAKWSWGNEDRPADAVLLVYAELEAEVQHVCERLGAEADATGQKIAATIRLQPLPPRHEPMREPFGFVDGISQPLLRDTPRGRAARNGIHASEPGEFVLGYLDNSGYYPSTPTVQAGLDPAHLLAEAVSGLPTQRPAFGTGGSDGRRDLGHNGTYLVIRQLEQDVDAFNRWLDQTADRPDSPLRALAPDRGLRRELVAAKVVGRWPSNGSSLVRNPERPAGQPGRRARDNDFLPGQEDPQGLRCPFGAHIRRANPRDSLGPDASASALSIANRHRIMRVSRPYQPPAEGEKPGTLFMCLNADVERQFEFIQQTYILGRNFQALEDEADPMLRPGRPGAAHFTVPTEDGPARLGALEEFVRVRGGGYFFMPARRTVRFLVERR